MNTQTIRERLIEKLNSLSDKELESIWQFVEKIETQTEKVDRDYERKEFLKKFDNLCQETEALHKDKPLTEEEIQEEIEAYRDNQ